MAVKPRPPDRKDYDTKVTFSEMLDNARRLGKRPPEGAERPPWLARDRAIHADFESLEEFLYNLKTTQYLVPDGNPRKEWKLISASDYYHAVGLVQGRPDYLAQASKRIKEEKSGLGGLEHEIEDAGDKAVKAAVHSISKTRSDIASTPVIRTIFSVTVSIARDIAMLLSLAEIAGHSLPQERKALMRAWQVVQKGYGFLYMDGPYGPIYVYEPKGPKMI